MKLIDAEQIKLTSESFCDVDGDVLIPLSEVRKDFGVWREEKRVG